MSKLYHDCFVRLWNVHDVATLKARDIALYFYLLNKANENDWRMPVHVAGRLLVPMLFGKSSLESARKRLIELGLIRCDVPKGNAASPAYYITGIGEEGNAGSESVFGSKPEEVKDEENAQKIVSTAGKFWDGFDEQAFNAKETALYFYLLHLAEKKQWVMPFRCFDAVIVPDMMQIRALEDARQILIQRNLIKYDNGDPKRTAPKYSIVLGGTAKVCRIPATANNSVTETSKATSDKTKAKPKKEQTKEVAKVDAMDNTTAVPEITTEANADDSGVVEPEPIQEGRLHGMEGSAQNPNEYLGSFIGNKQDGTDSEKGGEA